MAKKYAYVTLMTKDYFLPGVLLLNESLRRVKSKYKLICMVSNDLSQETFNILQQAKIKYKIVEKLIYPQHIIDHNMQVDPAQANGYSDCLTKLQCLKFVDYDKIIFCDADLLILKNVDHCFKMPHMTAALDGEYFNLWPQCPHFNSGFLVLKPDIKLFNTILDFTANLDVIKINTGKGNMKIIADQDILNFYYSNWPYNKQLHLNKYYNIFAPHISTTCGLIDDILQNAYFLHFVGQKPWYTIEVPLNILQLTTNTKYVATESFILAASLHRLIIDNQFYPLNWPSIEKHDALISTIINTSLNNLNIDFAKKCLNQLDKKSLAYQTALSEIRNTQKLLDITACLEHVIATYDKYNSFQVSGIDFYSLFQHINSHITDIQQLYDSTLYLQNLWERIEVAIRQYLEQILKDSNFDS